MLSDFLSGVIERYFQRLLPKVKDARLFRMERGDAPPTTPRAELDRWEPDARVIENYRLPFGSIVIEEADFREDVSDRCAFLWDIDADARRFGCISASLDGPREVRFMICELVAFPDGALFSELANNLPLIARLEPGARVYTVQRAAHPSLIKRPEFIGDGAHNVQMRLDGPYRLRTIGGATTPEEMERVLAAKAGEEGIDPEALRLRTLGQLNEDYRELTEKVAVFTLSIFMLLILRINEPSRFVVEERPLQPLRNPVGGLPRSPWRSHYIVLEPQEIKTRLLGMDPNPPSGRKVAPHEKRGHFRRLLSERFKAKRGQVIWIRPCWVGPQEGIVGKNKYVVRLDADSAPRHREEAVMANQSSRDGRGVEPTT